MKIIYKLILFTLLFNVFSNCIFAQASLIKSATKEAVEFASKKSAKELAEFGGEKAVNETLEYIAKNAGQTALKQTLSYTKEYGFSALKAIKVSPKNIISALDQTPANARRTLTAIVNKDPLKIKNRLEKESADFLIVEAKAPGLSARISELGADATSAAKNMSSDEIAKLALKKDALLKVKSADSSQYSKLLQKLKEAPAATLSLLEKNPKVLLTAAALTAYLSSSELQETTSNILYVLAGVVAFYFICKFTILSILHHKK